ncbi:helix-turn-helix domain-containing protein [Cognaticolwellia beringensis]|uniref:AraC family transcriptional regulator n=1 Tax=Cognaticolwellia beringensis TaxID=1967665 RepID=A0A222G8I7_9GAMM|nr:AraC family transcriptional regulator [Cognaticolwellia beringensis]ASP48218.1 AraC family transcriptional regulator [Cognaticolwellia beringensis]
MTDPVVMIISMVMLGQILLSVPILLSRAMKSVIFLPLAIFLLANSTIALVPIVNAQFPDLSQLYSAIVFPTLFLLCPCLWFYIEGITAEKPWKLNKKQTLHFVLFWPALIVGVMIMFLPKDMYTDIFINDIDVVAPLAIVTAIGLLVMMMLWLGQCVYIAFRIIYRLVDYRKQLKNVFSNHDDKSLNWMNWLLFIAISTWLFSLVTVFSSNLFDNFLFNIRTDSLLSLLLVWSLAHFGLQQKPVFTDYSESESVDIAAQNTEAPKNEDVTVRSPPMKYQRSALDNEQSNRIADKINNIMSKETLYLDSNLSLQKLANHLAISPNYISQTLNETLCTNFFDFINKWRIEAAKPKILANKDSVLTIALEVGFNARSSFYKAFKQETGQTPSEFRKQDSSH